VYCPNLLSHYEHSRIRCRKNIGMTMRVPLVSAIELRVANRGNKFIMARMQKLNLKLNLN